MEFVKKNSLFDGISVADAVRLAKEGKLNSESADRLAREKRATEKKKTKTKSHATEYDDIEPVPLVPNHNTRFLPKGLKEAEVKSLFLDKTRIIPAASILRHPLDPRYKKEGGAANLISIRQGEVSLAKHPDVIMKIADLPREKFSAGDIARIRRLIRESYEYQVTNGPLSSMFARVTSALAKSLPQGKGLAKYYPRVSAMLPYSKDRLWDMRGRTPDMPEVRLNLNSGSGFPFDSKKRDVVKQSYELAVEVLNAITEGKLALYAQDHREFFVSKLMNKLDPYIWDDHQVRAFFSCPFHLTWLFSCVFQNYAGAIQNFVENSHSISAHRFSWLNGGGDQLYVQLVRLAEKPPGLYAIVYSDDQLWVLVTADKKAHVIALDWKRMDLHLAGFIGQYTARMIEERMRPVLDETWLQVARFACKYAFSHETLVGYSLVCILRDMLHSGVPGTPEFNEVGSALALCIAQDEVGTPDDVGAATAALTRAFERIKVEVGLEVKPGTDRMYEFVAGEPEYPFTFLGKTLVRIGGGDAKTHYLPKSDPVKALASLISPKRNLSGVPAMRAQMERVRQIVSAGAFHERMIYYGCQVWYQTMQKLENRPADPFEDDDTDIGYAGKPIPDFLFPSNDYPSWEWMANLYLPADARLVFSADAARSDGSPAVKPGNGPTAQEAMASVFDLGSTMWADVSEIPERVPEPRHVVPVGGLVGKPVQDTNQMGRAVRDERKSALRKAFTDHVYLAYQQYRGKTPRTWKKGAAKTAARDSKYHTEFNNFGLMGSRMIQAASDKYDKAVDAELAGGDDAPGADDYYVDRALDHLLEMDFPEEALGDKAYDYDRYVAIMTDPMYETAIHGHQRFDNDYDVD